MSSNSVQVVVRLRPLNEREKKHGTLPVISASTNDKTVTVIKGTGSRQARSAFAFDNVFTAFSTQEEVFETTMRPVIKDVLTGFESTVFAYGQTGTGKTHTMEGDLDHPENYGIIPRSAGAIFEQLNKKDNNYESYRILCSYLEIYNEDLCDLLAEPDSTGRTPSKNNHDSLAIMEGKNGPFCRGLSRREVHSASDLLGLMRTAQQSRRVGETNMNKQSSRSHCIFTLLVEAKRRLPDGAVFETKGKLHMVDLAGSECAKSANLDGGGGEQVARDRERMNINRSLLTLGRVVKMLKEESLKGSKAGNVRIPYRDSKLTRILQQALGGNSKTVIVATLSPSVTAIEESQSTLNYAQAAHGIINKPTSASYMSQSTGSSMVLAGAGASGNGQVGSIEKWTEMETRLEYMQCQVEEAKAALARKHLQQQELVDRAEQAESDRKAFEEKAHELTLNNTVLTEELGHIREKCEQVEDELSKTRGELEKTTLVLHATQETETNLTKEANSLIQALKQSISDGDQLYETIVENRQADMKRRQVAKQFNTSIASILTDVKETLAALTQQESIHYDRTKDLATDVEINDMQFLERVKGVLQSAVESVESAAAAIKANIHEQDGIVPTADALAQDTYARVGESYSILEKGEEQLLANFQSARKKIKEFGKNLTELENVQNAFKEEAISTLEKNVALHKRRTEKLIKSTCEAMERVKENRKQMRETTRETIAKWKASVISSGDGILKQSSTQHESVEQTLQMMTAEMQRHDAIASHLSNQTSLLQFGQASCVESNIAQKQLLQQTQTTVKESHEQQAEMLSSFVGKVMKGVEMLVQEQVSEVLSEAQKGHTKYLENNASLMKNHDAISSSTIETLQAAKSLAANIQEDAAVAKENDSAVITHLSETKSILSEIQSTVEIQSSASNNFAAQACQQLQTADDMEGEDIKIQEQLVVNGNNCSDHLTGAFLTDTSTHIVSLYEEGKSMSNFVRTEVFDSMTSAIAEMEKPRNEMMASFANECSQLKDGLDEGLSNMKEKASDISNLADKLNSGITSVATDFNNVTTKEWKAQIEKTKKELLLSASKQLDIATQKIDRSQTSTKSMAATTNDFVRADLMAYDEVKEPLVRTQITFSEDLSKTPSEHEILGFKEKLNDNIEDRKTLGKILQDLSPNEEMDKVSPPKRKSHIKPIGQPAQKFPRKKRESRNENNISS